MADYATVGMVPPRAMDLQIYPPTIPILRLAIVGGIGFQLTGGIIVVEAHDEGIDVSFDRPMTFLGDYTSDTGGNPYDIDQPELNALARMLSIPIIPYVPPRLPGNETAVSASFESPITPIAAVVENSVPIAAVVLEP